jgi:hypothetical protein
LPGFSEALTEQHEEAALVAKVVTGIVGRCRWLVSCGFLAYFAVGAVPGAFVGGARAARQQGPERWQQVWPESRVMAGSPGVARD